MSDEFNTEDTVRLQDEKTEAGRVEEWDRKVVTALMETVEGRYWVERFLEHCDMFSAKYRGDGDTAGTLWRDGRADAGRYLFVQIEKFCPDNYLRMIRERRMRIERAEKARKRKEDSASTNGVGLTAIDRWAEAQATQYRDKS